MAALTIASLAGTGARNSAPNTLTASDTFTYQRGDILILRNATAGTLIPNLKGDAAVSWPAPGLLPINTSAGRGFSLAAGAVRVVVLDVMQNFLEGTTVTITGAAGVIATILRR